MRRREGKWWRRGKDRFDCRSSRWQGEWNEVSNVDHSESRRTDFVPPALLIALRQLLLAGSVVGRMLADNKIGRMVVRYTFDAGPLKQGRRPRRSSSTAVEDTNEGQGHTKAVASRTGAMIEESLRCWVVCRRGVGRESEKRVAWPRIDSSGIPQGQLGEGRPE